MATTESIIDAALLSVCPSAEAVQWLRHKREQITNLNSVLNKDYAYQEQVLVHRNDPYIDFGLARYGTSEDAAKLIYSRGDLGIRCTLLAHFPNGGFARYFEGFSLNGIAPQTIEELSALVTNSSLSNNLFEQCFEKKGIFGRSVR